MSEIEPPERHVESGAPSQDRSALSEDACRSAALFAQLFDVSPFSAVVSRLSDHTVLAINQCTSELFGVPQAEAIGQNALDYYVDPSERASLAETVRREGRADNVRLHIKRPNGEPLWVLASSRLITFAGDPAVMTVFTDISDQLEAERVLRASERRLAAQSTALTDLTARHADRSGQFDDRLRAILRTAAHTLEVERLSMWCFGGGRDSITCLGLYECSTDRYESGAVLHRDQSPPYFDAVERDRVVAVPDVRTDPRTTGLEAYLTDHGIGAMLDVPLRLDNLLGGVLCAEHVGGPREWTVDEQNFAISTANLVVVASADEDRRQALARVADSDALAHLIVDTAHDAFIGMDTTGGIVTWNAQAERTFGWTRDEALGRNLADTIIPAGFRDAHARGIRRFLETGDAPVVNRRLELSALHRTGREFPVEITITSPMPREGGFFFGAFLRDISARREQDELLRRAKESAEAATRAKSEFLANMSHELRTPLNGVLGYTQLLQRDGTLDAGHREALDAIAKCGAHLLELINDVLDLSKIEAGRVDIEASVTDLVQLTIDVKSVVSDSAARKGLRLSVAVAPGVPRRVVLDRRHLRQVILNLLGNAIKFTAQGEVRLGIACSEPGGLSFEVSDTGVGIEPGALAEIFDAFTQTRTGAAAGGTGLGLTISRHLVETMGGDLKVESTLGQGSRFFFTLPLVPAGDASRQEPEQGGGPPFNARLAPGEELTALVVDDSTVNRRILASLLESAGVAVITAAGGIEALWLARANRPDVIFMDIKMSDLDGLEVTRQLALGAETARIPVIAVTASAFGDTRQAARDAGCIDYIPKPVRAESIFASLQTHLGIRFVTHAAEPPPEESELSDPARRLEVASRLRGAVTMGDVTDIEKLTQELMAGSAEEAALGRQIAGLGSTFDFDGLRALADTLAIEEGAGRAGA